MIERFLFELRRVIVNVMARAAVPNSSSAGDTQGQQQLGFDFGASPEAPSVRTVPFATPVLVTTSSSLNGMTTLPPNGRGVGYGAPRLVGSSHAMAIDTPAHTARVGVDAGMPALSNGTYDVSPFAAPSNENLQASSAPEVASPPKSRGRAAVRARTGVMFSRLQELGLRGIDTLVLMRTRTVMVSLIGQTLRVHEGYADAPEPVLRAIVTFATARHRATRVAARDAILAHDVERAPASRRAEPAKPGDIALIAALMLAHREMNDRSFGGTLNEIPIRLSGRMATRLGHFDPGSRLTPPEIVMSRRHVVRHGWKEAMHTLLHEMVHQWQHETGQPVDHLAGFRKKCREVGITPAARRLVTPLKTKRRTGAA